MACESSRTAGRKQEETLARTEARPFRAKSSHRHRYAPSNREGVSATLEQDGPDPRDSIRRHGKKCGEIGLANVAPNRAALKALPRDPLLRHPVAADKGLLP
jgi:hypothetical protein